MKATLTDDGWQLDPEDIDAPEQRPGIFSRIFGRKAGPEPRKLSTGELGGPSPRPLIAGRFAGPDMSLKSYLGHAGGLDDLIPLSDAAVLQKYRQSIDDDRSNTQESPFGGDPSAVPEVQGIGVQRSPFV